MPNPAGQRLWQSLWRTPPGVCFATANDSGNISEPLSSSDAIVVLGHRGEIPWKPNAYFFSSIEETPAAFPALPVAQQIRNMPLPGAGKPNRIVLVLPPLNQLRWLHFFHAVWLFLPLELQEQYGTPESDIMGAPVALRDDPWLRQEAVRLWPGEFFRAGEKALYTGIASASARTVSRVCYVDEVKRSLIILREMGADKFAAEYESVRVPEGRDRSPRQTERLRQASFAYAFCEACLWLGLPEDFQISDLRSRT